MKGSIQRHHGKRGMSWYAVVDLPPDPTTGKRRQKRVSAPTKRECEEKVRELLHRADQAPFTRAANPNVAQLIEQWLEFVEPSLRSSSYRRYRDTLILHVVPIIGHVKLSKLSPPELQRLYANRLAFGLSPTTVHHLHVVLHRMLKHAVRWGLVARNVSEMIDPPRRTFPEITTWNEEQVTRFLRAGDGHHLAAFWRLALLTGMRRGELLGLKWEDANLDRGTVSVRRTLSRGVGGTWELGELKTNASRRSIALPHSCVLALRKHKAVQNAERLRLGEIWEDNGFIFTNRTGGPLHVNSMAPQFKKLIQACDLPRIRFHDLRHTSATFLLGRGVHPKIVQERLGHADISMTLNLYSHVTPDMQRAAADTIDDALSSVS